MFKWIKRLAALLLILFIALLLTYYQPWEEFSPAQMSKTFLVDERIEHFRNMNKLYPTHLIKKAEITHQWKNAAAPLDVAYEFKGKSTTLADYLERTITTGFVVIKDGTIIFEQYRLGETEKSLHASWSVAKSFVSTIIGMAIDEGKIESLNDKIEKYVPELAGKAYGQVPIKDLLQMSSGINFNESYGAPGSNTALAFSDVQKTTYATWLFGIPINQLIGDYEKVEEPGERWQYRSSDTQILGWLAEKVYNQPFAKILEERLWQPMGMESDANWQIDGSDDESAVTFCCLNAILRDYARLGELYRLGGNWNGQQLLSQQWIIDATTPDNPHVQPENVKGYRGYQYHWWVPESYNREYFASGVWGQNIWVDEKRGVVIARTAVDPNFMPNKEENIVMLRAVSAFVADKK